MMKSPHEILGVAEACTPAELKKAYRKMAQKYHPDKNRASGSAEHFKLIREAYDFILTGKSSAGTFDRKEPPKAAPKPPPTYADPSPRYGTYGGYTHPEATVNVKFSEIFGGARVNIPGTHFYIDVPVFAQNGMKRRVLAKTWNHEHQIVYDVEFHLKDPTGFHQLKMIDKKLSLYSQVKVSSGDLLSGISLYLKNINPALSDVKVKLEAGQKLIKVEESGLPDHSGKRGIYYVEPIVEFKPLSKERFDTLISLRDEVNEMLSSYYKRNPIRTDI